MNINTKNYWEERFATGDWDVKQGREQTRRFALAQVRYLRIPRDFAGTILDFGCGLGDAMPVYRAAYPRASLMGIDISDAAIAQCRTRYGRIARFLQGDHRDVPPVDVIIASNVFEHLSDDLAIARHLLALCADLFIVTPYRETIYPGTEHINSYDEEHFAGLGPCGCQVFCSRGWSQYGWKLWFRVYAKNLLRPVFGRARVTRRKQILFHFPRRTAAAGTGGPARSRQRMNSGRP